MQQETTWDISISREAQAHQWVLCSPVVWCFTLWLPLTVTKTVMPWNIQEGDCAVTRVWEGIDEKELHSPHARSKYYLKEEPN
jgi:hypothetical protein